MPQAASMLGHVVLFAALLATGGCHGGPDLRPIATEATPTSIDEGRRLLEEGRAALAVSAFRRLLRQDGADLLALNGLAIAYAELGRPDLAAEMFSKALAMAPNDPATLNNIGFSALRRADPMLARHYLERAKGQAGGQEEIEGNLAGLALLESIDRTASSGSAPTRATLFSAAVVPGNERRTPQSRIAFGDDSRPGAAFEPRRRAPRSPPDAMIDFTAVLDPFADRGAKREHP